jgi:sulfite dehydrogenase (quinone) subunit SoeC
MAVVATDGAERGWRGLLAGAVIVSGSLASGALLAGSTMASLWSLAGFMLIQSAYWLVADVPRPEPVTGTGGWRSGPRGAAALCLAGLVLAAALPLALIWAFPFKHGLAAGVVALHLIGMVVLRWHNFVSADHKVGLAAKWG